MPSPTVATSRRKKAPESPGGSRKRKRSVPSKASARTRLATRRLGPIAVIAAGVFLVAYILDWNSVTALMWACLDGEFGLLSSIVSFGILFLLVFAIALIWQRPMPEPAAKAGRKTRQTVAKPKKAVPAQPEEAIAPDEQPAAVDIGPKSPRKPKVTQG